MRHPNSPDRISARQMPEDEHETTEIEIEKQQDEDTDETEEIENEKDDTRDKDRT
jgi:hypothetical protein